MPIASHSPAAYRLREYVVLVWAGQPDQRKQNICVLGSKRFSFRHAHKLTESVQVDAISGCNAKKKPDARLTLRRAEDDG